MVYNRQQNISFVIFLTSTWVCNMKICVFFLLLLATTCVLGDPPLFPIKTEDMQNIVDSVKKDVDRHLKVAYANRQSSLDSPELPSNEADDGKEYRNFMKMIQNSMHHHLVRNLGQPSDAMNEGRASYSKPTQEDIGKLGTKSVSQQVSESTTIDHSELPEAYEIRVGSVKGVAGINFPDYTDIPITTFSCSQKPHLPGFYADLDTGCQVFHFCWPDRRESFLCPMGTTFNQALGVCDYWYNSNCSLAPYYYTINAEVKQNLSEPENNTTVVDALLEESVLGTRKPDSTSVYSTTNPTLDFISRFMPIKAKVVVYPKTATQRLKIVTTASVGEDKKANLKPKRQQTSNTSKHKRLPRSVEYAKSSKDADIKDQEYEITRFRLFEALNRALIDIENDESVSALSGYARTALKFVKSVLSFLFMEEPLDHISPEPGSELYEFDMQAVKTHKNLREVWKKFLVLIATFMDEETEKEVVPEDVKEPEVSDSEPLTNLNPKFIIKPASEQTSKLQHQEMLQPVREKRSLTISHPLKSKHKDRLTIHPITKKVLLKNYLKLFKTEYKH